MKDRILKNKYSIICGILVILWMISVFLFSNQASVESTTTSGNFITHFVTFFNSYLSEEKIQEIVNILQPIVRKLAHFSLYTLGGILIATFFYTLKSKVVYVKSYSIALGSIYACTDEIHQLYVPGRSGEIRDILIDTVGIIFGVFIVVVIRLLVKRIVARMKKRN